MHIHIVICEWGLVMERIKLGFSWLLMLCCKPPSREREREIVTSYKRAKWPIRGQNLLNRQQVVTDFCDASRGLINWDKSMGVWVASSSPPQDVPTPSFSWVPWGTTLRYLGCHVGLDLSAIDMITPLLLWVRNKLLYWDTTNLSLPGRVVVATVLLASMW